MRLYEVIKFKLNFYKMQAHEQLSVIKELNRINQVWKEVFILSPAI